MITRLIMCSQERVLINSDQFDNLESSVAKTKIIDTLI